MKEGGLERTLLVLPCLALPSPIRKSERRALGCYAKAAVYADLWSHLLTDCLRKTINVSESIPNVLFRNPGIQHERISLYKIEAGYPLQGQAVLLKSGFVCKRRVQ